MGGRPMDQLIWGSVRKPAGSLMKELRFISAKSSGKYWVEQDSWSSDLEAKYDARPHRAFSLKTVTHQPKYW